MDLHTNRDDADDAVTYVRTTPERGVVNSIQDFSENWGIHPKREHQSKYFSDVGVTVYVSVLYIHIDDLKNISEEEREELWEGGEV